MDLVDKIFIDRQVDEGILCSSSPEVLVYRSREKRKSEMGRP